MAMSVEKQVAVEAKERQAEYFGNQHDGLSSNLNEVQKEPIRTASKAAESIGVSENTYLFGRCLMELERIYGIQHGGDRKSEEKSNPQDAELKSQEDLASELGMSVDGHKRRTATSEKVTVCLRQKKTTKTKNER